MMEKPVVAICYDFDKTLSPDDMQAQGFIQDTYQGDVSEFWAECGRLSGENDMDGNLAYMYMMLRESRGKLLFNRKTLMEYGAGVALFPGVEEWFSRICAFGEEHGVTVEHYIISSGLKEMIEGTSIAPFFKRIYASSFYYDENGLVAWPAQVINYTNKTQFLFRISKGCLDINDPAVNDVSRAFRVPFTHMVYMGDSDTDIPCMKLIKSYGGTAIGIHNGNAGKVERLLAEGRISAFAAADYRPGSEVDTLVKELILKVKNDRNEKTI